MQVHRDAYYLAERSPVSPADLASLGYRDLIEAYFAVHSKATQIGGLSLPDQHRVKNIATALDTVVRNAWRAALAAPAEEGGVDQFHQPMWSIATLHTLEEQHIMIDPGFRRTWLTHTRQILDGMRTKVDFEHFRDLLHLTPRVAPHTYTAEIELIDVAAAAKDLGKLGSVLASLAKNKKLAAQVTALKKRLTQSILRRLPLAGFIGGMVVKKDDSSNFEGVYGIILGGFGASRSSSMGADVTYSSSGGTAKVWGQAWLPEHIAGIINTIEAGGAFWGGETGKGASGSLMSCFGGGPGKPHGILQINFSGSSDVVGPGIGAQLGVNLLVGSAIYGNSFGGDATAEIPEHVEPLEYGTHTAVGPLHFPINGARLSPPAMELLQIFAAIELPALSMPDVELEIEGWADQPDEAIRNKILSRNRAISVYNYLKNILGAHLATGELEALPTTNEETGTPEEVMNPSRFLEHVNIVAQGEPPPSRGKGKPREQFDPAFRRVDMWVNGEIQLVLRRRSDE